VAKKTVRKKSITAGSDITNTPLRDFLLKLAVDDAFRADYSGKPNDDERKALLIADFEMGANTAEAVVRGTAGQVKARFGVSDQTGLIPVPPPRKKATKAAAKTKGAGKKR
jgi:hypothetical protein